MYDSQSVADALTRAGVNVSIVDGRLRLKSRFPLDEELLARVRQCKPQLMRIYGNTGINTDTSPLFQRNEANVSVSVGADGSDSAPNDGQVDASQVATEVEEQHGTDTDTTRCFPRITPIVSVSEGLSVSNWASGGNQPSTAGITSKISKQHITDTDTSRFLPQKTRVVSVPAAGNLPGSRPPEPCPTCGAPGVWVDVYGSVHCGGCLEPPSRSLVASKWIIVHLPDGNCWSCYWQLPAKRDPQDEVEDLDAWFDFLPPVPDLIPPSRVYSCRCDKPVKVERIHLGSVRIECGHCGGFLTYRSATGNDLRKLESTGADRTPITQPRPPIEIQLRSTIPG